jgi:hypothetical protein
MEKRKVHHGARCARQDAGEAQGASEAEGSHQIARRLR